jgi:hypothetical protein
MAAFRQGCCRRSDTVAATLAFLIVLAAAVLLHRSAHFLQNQLPKFCIWLIYGVAGVLVLLDVAGFVLLVLPAFGSSKSR